MIALVAVPLLLGALLAVAAGPLTRAMDPRLSVPLVTASALSAALCTGIVLSAAAVLACAQLGPFPALGQWSAAVLRSRSGLPLPVGLTALVVVVGCLGAALVRAGRSARGLRLARRASVRMRPTSGNLVLLDASAPVAYSIAGAGGRVVVSTGMFAALSADERRVLLAHENAHLRHHHHIYLHLVRLAAAANPLLRPAVRVVQTATERWADEEAAASVGNRRVAARALARAATASTSAAGPAYALAVTEHAVIERVRSLLAPPPTQRRLTVLSAAVAVAVGWAAAAVITVWANDVVQLAEAVYQRR